MDQKVTADKRDTNSPEGESGRIFWLILLSALILRLLCLSQSLDNPTLFIHDLDEAYYLDFARTVAGGDFIAGSEPFHMDPLYGYLLGGLFAALGDNLAILWIAQIIIDCLSVLMVFLLGRKLWNNRAALVAALLYALYRPALFYPLLALKTTLTAAGLLAFTLILLHLRDKPDSRGWLAAGIMAGLLTTLRANLLLLIPFSLTFILWNRWPAGWQSSTKTLAAFCAGALLFPLIVGTRNLAASGSFTMLNSQGGRLLYSCNNPENLTGTYAVPSFARATINGAKKDFREEAERRLGKTLSSRQSGSYWYKEALSFWLDHPDLAARSLFNKILFTLGNHEVPTNQSFEVAGYFAPVLRWPLPSFAILFGLGLVGIPAGVKKNRSLAIILIPLGTVLTTMLVFYASSRLRFPATPFLAIGAGVETDLIWQKFRKKDRSYILLLGLTAGLTGISFIIPGPQKSGFEELLLARSFLAIGDFANTEKWARTGSANFPNRPEFHRLLGLNALHRDRAAAAAGFFMEAVKREPDNPESYNQLAYALLMSGKYLEGQKAITAALALRPNQPDFLLNQARLFKARGEPGEAENILQKLLSRQHVPAATKMAAKKLLAEPGGRPGAPNPPADER